jgi:hypothetical protein
MAKWIDAHRDELAKHAGRFIALSPTIGIIGVSDDYQAAEAVAGTAEDATPWYVPQWIVTSKPLEACPACDGAGVIPADAAEDVRQRL